MINPEILKMVEECKRQCATCKYDNRGLCDGFELHTGRLPDNCNEKDIENILSFLTSQEVCECVKGKLLHKYIHGIKIEKKHMFRKPEEVLYVEMEYCPFCGGKLIKGVISEKDLLKPFSEFEKENNIKGIRNDMDKKGE